MCNVCVVVARRSSHDLQGLGSPLVLATIKGHAAAVAVLLEHADVDVNQLSVRQLRRDSLRNPPEDALTRVCDAAKQSVGVGRGHWPRTR